MDYFKSFTKKLVLICILFACLTTLKAQAPQGQRPTTFPDLLELTDSTLFFTQDSISQQSYKFTLGKLKSYLDMSSCLDSSFANIINCPPAIQLRNGDSSLNFTNTLQEIFSNLGDTSGVYQLCDATSAFPMISSLASIVDSNFITIDSTEYCNESILGGFEFSQDFPVDVQLCEGGYISQIRLKAYLTDYTINFEIEPPSLAGLTLNVNGQNVTPSNAQPNIPEGLIVLGNLGSGYENNEFVYDLTTPTPINSVRATFVWLKHASFKLDGLKVTYKISNCSCGKKFLTTDSLGCLKLDTLDTQSDLDAQNGLRMQDNTFKLGGTLTENTNIYGNTKQLNINLIESFHVYSSEHISSQSKYSDFSLNADGIKNFASKNYFEDSIEYNLYSESRINPENYSITVRKTQENNNDSIINPNRSSNVNVTNYGITLSANQYDTTTENYSSVNVQPSSIYMYSQDANNSNISTGMSLGNWGGSISSNSYNIDTINNHSISNYSSEQWTPNNILTSVQKNKVDTSNFQIESKNTSASINEQMYQINSNSYNFVDSTQYYSNLYVSPTSIEIRNQDNISGTLSQIQLNNNSSTISSINNNLISSLNTSSNAINISSSNSTNGNNSVISTTQESISLYNNAGTYYIQNVPQNDSSNMLLGISNNQLFYINKNTVKPYNYTPTSSTDTYGNVGDVAYDDDYVYVRTSVGWKRTALGTW